MDGSDAPATSGSLDATPAASSRPGVPAGPPSGGAGVRSPALQPGPDGPHLPPADAEVRAWPVRELAWDGLGEGACDLRDLLDAPAGRHGRVGVRNGHLVAADGTRMRFWGCNLVFGAAFPPADAAGAQAERLARAGFNLVRIHHPDSAHGPGYFDYARAGPDGLPLHAENMERFDRLFAELKARGIYVHLDLYTLRQFGPREDAPPGLRAGQKHVVMYDERLRRLYDATVARLLLHTNPHTGLRYADDPAVAVVQLLNEQSMQWWDAPPEAPGCLERLGAQWNRWLLHRYGTRQALEAAWAGPVPQTGGGEGGQEALQPHEDPARGTVSLPRLASWHEPNHPSLTARRRDGRLFLWEVQVAFARHGRTLLRTLGYGGLVNLSNLPGGLAGLYGLAAPESGMDVVENNAYWDHPEGGFRPPVRHHRLPMVAAHPFANGRAFSRHLVPALAAGRVDGVPFIVTEAYQAAANPWRAEMPLWLAAYACLQDWDGVLLFSYSHAGTDEQRRRPRISGSFDAWNDPAVWDVLPAAALLFHRGDVAAAREVHLLGVADPFAGTDGAPHWRDWWAPLGGDAFRHRVAVAFGPEPARAGGAGAAGAGQGEGAGSTALNAEQRAQERPARRTEAGTAGADVAAVLEADTGELSWDRPSGILRIAAGRTAGAVGFLGGRTVDAGPLRLMVETPFAAVLVQARDGAPLERSRHLLVTAVARAANEGAAWDGDTLLDEGAGPVRAEPVVGQVRLPWGEMLTLDGRPHLEVRRG